MNGFTTTMLSNCILISTAMLILWIIATLRSDVSIVDLFWGTGFAIIGWTSWGLNSSPAARQWLLVWLTTIWGLRLSLYLTWRNWGKAEDRRYKAMRDHHGERFWYISVATIFLLQGGLMWFISLPIQAAVSTPTNSPLGMMDLVGVTLWGIGMIFESVGDWQLAKFKTVPSNNNRVMNQGLWKYTRHPNYFGDFCIWWGLYLVASAGGAGWTIASPLIMSLLLMKVSGVTLLEQTITERRPEYAAYKLQTSAFFPWFPSSPVSNAEWDNARQV